MAKYLHGYSKEEQFRLIKQARFLAPWIYPGIDFRGCRHILEVGCGVGAQTEILLKRFPRLKITGVDISRAQLELAQRRLANPIAKGRVELIEADATDIPLKNQTFDGAFLCWFLEHVPSPLRVLSEVHRKLRPGAKVYCSEVFNSTLFVDPYSPAILKYWFEFNDHQWSIQGHPFVGAQLGNLLKRAGFRAVETELRPLHFDSRDPALRRKFIRYWTELMLSAAPALLKARRIRPKDLSALKKELRLLADSRESVFFFAWMRAFARKS